VNSKVILNILIFSLTTLVKIKKNSIAIGTPRVLKKKSSKKIKKRITKLVEMNFLGSGFNNLFQGKKRNDSAKSG